MGKFTLETIKGKENKERKEALQKDSSTDIREVKVGAAFFKDVDKRRVGEETIFIPRNQIDKNPNNFYSVNNIVSLAQSIKYYGLDQPLIVSCQENGRYMLTGGERRLTAIDWLIADEKSPDWTEDVVISCVVKDPENIDLDLSSPGKEKFAIITSNREARVYTDGDKYQEIQEWKSIIEELRANGVEYISGYDLDGNESEIQIKGKKTREILVETTGMSSGQISKYENVAKKGTEKLKNSLLDGTLTISAANKAASILTAEEQDVLAKDAKTSNIKSEDVGKYKKERIAPKHITSTVFLEDCEKIMSVINSSKVVLDEKSQKKYDNYIRQMLNLLSNNQMGENS